MKKRFLALLLVSCLFTACAQEQAETTEYSAPETVAATENPSPERILPLPCSVDLDQLEDCTLDISLEKDALTVDEAGTFQMQLTVHVYDRYAFADISRMKPGDILSINGQDLQVTSLEETSYGSILINGGLEKGGHELRTKGGVYYETGFSDVRSYYAIGTITLPLAPDFVYIDASDLDQGEARWSAEAFASMYEKIAQYFQPSSTSIVVEKGVVTSLTRIYVP